MSLPGLPPELRGTYAGLAHPAAIAHFKALGVTTLELLPIHYHLDEAGLADKGLVNYWGYNSLGFFAPAPRYASTDDAALEFWQIGLGFDVRVHHGSGSAYG